MKINAIGHLVKTNPNKANFRKNEVKMIMGMKQLWYVTVLVLLLGKPAPVAELATKKALTLEVYETNRGCFGTVCAEESVERGHRNCG